jgi:hypothetical protein
VEPHVQPLASPPVLAVVVTRDPRVDRLEPLLRALSEQDYPNLSVIVVDAANRVLDLPLARGAAFFVFCRDDVVPDPGAVRALVDAATEWRAAVVGPKFVAADDPRRLLSVGLMVDRVGTTLPLVERRELDQGQHDGVRRVFAVPAGFTLVRAWRFAETGGFDDAVDAPDDDLILSWRARAAGCRVLVAPAARVRRPDGPPPSPATTTAAACGPCSAARAGATWYGSSPRRWR